eukprot:c34605_g1_i1 orf=90-338(-)
MVLLGTVRQHSAEFCFCWQLCRVVATEYLWTAKKKLVFQQEKREPANLAKDCFTRIGTLLWLWPSKGKGEARQLAFKWKEVG